MPVENDPHSREEHQKLVKSLPDDMYEKYVDGVAELIVITAMAMPGNTLINLYKLTMECKRKGFFR